MRPLNLMTIAACTLGSAAILQTANASTFYPGTVINISKFDVLNVRKWPSHTSRIVIGEPNNAPLSMTGRCKNTRTNGSFRIDGSQSSKWKYRRMRRAHVWCQIMSRTNELSWVRGKYVWPK